MKKFAAIVLALVLSIMFCSAFAQVKTFGMALITDLEGNTMYVVLTDNTITDPEGNPVDTVPYITVSLDDETNTFEMSTADQAVSGSVEVLESTEEQVALQLTPDGIDNPLAAIYTIEGSELTIIDEANNMMVVLLEDVA